MPSSLRVTKGYMHLHRVCANSKHRSLMHWRIGVRELLKQWTLLVRDVNEKKLEHLFILAYAHLFPMVDDASKPARYKALEYMPSTAVTAAQTANSDYLSLRQWCIESTRFHEAIHAMAFFYAVGTKR
jgi:hypothetical protein